VLIRICWPVIPSIHIINVRNVESIEFNCYVHGSVRRESISITVQQDATIYSLLYFCKVLYMFRVTLPPIIRSTYKCNYSIWHWSNCICYMLTPTPHTNQFQLSHDSGR
jgi:hypothetical protein